MILHYLMGLEQLFEEISYENIIDKVAITLLEDGSQEYRTAFGAANLVSDKLGGKKKKKESGVRYLLKVCMQILFNFMLLLTHSTDELFKYVSVIYHFFLNFNFILYCVIFSCRLVVSYYFSYLVLLLLCGI